MRSGFSSRAVKPDAKQLVVSRLRIKAVREANMVMEMKR